MDTYYVNEKMKAGKDESIGLFFVFQLKDDAFELLFMDHKWHVRNQIAVTVENYEVKCAGILQKGMCIDDIYMFFNCERPEGFTGHAVSISDVIVTVTEDGIASYFVDSFGFIREDTFMDAWSHQELILAFTIADRIVTIQSVDEGYEYDICDANGQVLDGGVYDDDTVCILEAIKQIIMDLTQPDMKLQDGVPKNRCSVQGNAKRSDFIYPLDEEIVHSMQEDKDFTK